MKCPSIVDQKVCVEAKITIEPEAELGDVHACCVGKPRFEERCKKSRGCTYMVSQMLCVRFPLMISAKVFAEPAGIVCNKPKVKPCRNEDMPGIEEMPCKVQTSCFQPMPFFERMQEEMPCIEEKETAEEVYDHMDAPLYRREKPMMRRRGFCFPPLFCLPFFCQRRVGFVQSKRRSKHPWL